ncbi:hypothetical protein K5V21_14460 [Clostridium sardiniense]|uniref:Uncharacterized protein n=1 Tax=Clostridium sardiniense TaxID=29369 RepID=A0ABS7L199_CLOSR|nr:hypothetical protein [Clostridium sardiniense]MBY0756648.1 hypothetical protein [Clostridium sardiniense]MDQ0458606.1 hypothetical protein [Clostridium sardiniense]
MNEKVMTSHYDDLVKLTNLLSSYVNSYRLLVAGASELNTIYGRKSREVQKAIDRADDIGGEIDELIKVIDLYQDSYLNYSRLKNEIVSINYKNGKIKEELKGVIQTEIDKELKFFNQPVPNQSSPIRDEDD